MPKPGDVEAAQMMGAAAEALTDVVLGRLGEHLAAEDHDIFARRHGSGDALADQSAAILVDAW